ncbi:MAG TPA: hypothetical protein VMU54_20750, partial [Planctomycetota bacterium]|nr:hypothetical protein [Planctomycetota bacterium]
YYKDLCTAVESAVVDAGRKAGAASMDQCLKQKKDQGLCLDSAIDACHKQSPQIRGFHGEALADLDFGKELGAVFQQMGLSPGAGQLAGRLADEVVVGPASSSAQADPRALPQYFDEKRQAYADRLGALLDQAAHRQAIATVDLRQALPEGAPPLSPDEIQQLSLLSPDERAAAVASISSALAIFEMGAQIAEVERALEVLKGVPTVDPAKRELLEDRLARLRSEKLRLTERLKDQSLVQEAYASARKLSTRQYSNRVAAVQSRAGQAERISDLLEDTAPIGALPPRTKAALPASGPGRTAAAPCDSCGLEGSFGSYAPEKP